MNTVIEIKSLHHGYEDQMGGRWPSLFDVDFAVQEGELVVLVGATGSGKSTLLQHMNGLIQPQEGTVRILGQDLSLPETDLQKIRNHVGLVFQRPEDQLFERYVGDDVAYGLRASGATGEELRERVRRAMETVGLDFELYKDCPVHALSGGERRKAGLAGVLAMEPRILLLDEPTSGLDPPSRAELLSMLGNLRSQGKSLVIATHNLDEVVTKADRVYVLFQGRVALSGATRDVITQVDVLRDLGMDVPAATALMLLLKAKGWDLPTNIVSPSVVVKTITAYVTARSARL